MHKPAPRCKSSGGLSSLQTACLRGERQRATPLHPLFNPNNNAPPGPTQGPDLQTAPSRLAERKE